MNCTVDYELILGLVGTVSGLTGLGVAILTHRRERAMDRSEKAYQDWLSKLTAQMLDDRRSSPEQAPPYGNVEALDKEASHIARALGEGRIRLTQSPDYLVWIQLPDKK